MGYEAFDLLNGVLADEDVRVLRVEATQQQVS